MRSPRLLLPAAGVVLLAGLLPSSASAGTAELRQAQNAVGGSAALRALRTFSYQATGEVSIFNESFQPGSPPTRAATFTQTVRHRLGSALAVRIEAARTSTANPRQVTELVNGTRGSINGQYGNQGQPAADQQMTSDRIGALLREQRLLNPHLLLRSLTARQVRAARPARARGATRRVLTVSDDVAPIRLYISRSGRLVRLTTEELDYMRRNARIVVDFSAWRAAGDVQFPTRVRVREDGFLVHTENRTAPRANPSAAASLFQVGGTAVPFDAALAERGEKTSRWLQAFAQLGFPKDGKGDVIQATEVAPGIHLLRGLPNQTIVIDRPSGVVVVEGAVHDSRAEAVIAYIQRTFPGKAITHAVSQHHHADHAGGFRPFVALGARLVAHESAVAFWRGVLGDRDSDVMPDRLDRSNVTAEVDSVPGAGQVDLPDTTHGLTVYPFFLEHAADSLMTYVPDAEVLVVHGDGYAPGSPNPGAGGRALDDQIRARGLSVKTIIGGHGGVASYEDFRRALGG